MAAVRQNGDALGVIVEETKVDRSIVIAAVQQNWRALRLVAEDMRA
eukprot:CAMPEP_0171267348 /NCGR_PEP_ID=MMETSP0790-20130122/59110_1 /TAXON_ID=2925 /ORGANISM="Alexandrium catenella, Strain OF101" /LENGTH=45 /DNA_ID= /DNA_START= /DNA_END= /DNA_ORIENTATION=